MDHTGCDLNKRSRETALLAVAIAGNYAREDKAADINNLQAVIYEAS